MIRLPPGTRPTDPQTMRQIEQAVRTGDMNRSVTLANEALRQGMVHPVLFHIRADLFTRQDRFAEALHEITQASLVAPDDTFILLAKARCHIDLGQTAGAIAACDAALALSADLAPAHYLKALAAELTGDLAVARAGYEEAMRLQPDLADAPARLANLAVRRNDWSAGNRLANAALALDPGNRMAALALARAELSSSDSAGAEKRLKELLSGDRTMTQEKALAYSLLGDALDKQKREEDAFAAYKMANVTLKGAFARVAPDSQIAMATLDGMNLFFDKATAQPPALATAPSAPEALGPARGHVFILSFPRSGTTLLGQILAGHHDVTVFEEKPLLTRASSELLASTPGLERLSRLTDAEMVAWRADYWTRARGFDAAIEGKVVVDQNPLNSLKLPLIARLFPDAKILFAVRDPRDVVFSCFRHLFAVSPYSFQLLELNSAARLYTSTMALADKCRALLPLAIHDVRHEELVSDFDGVTRATCDFIGIDWQESLRDFSGRSHSVPVTTASAIQVGRGLNSDGVAQWRRYAEELAPVLPRLAPWVERFGYPKA